MIDQIDLSTYLPQYVSDYREIKQIAIGETPEIETLKNELQIISNNQYIISCDETGIKRFETLLHISPNKDDTLNIRKSRVLSKWNNLMPITLKSLKIMLNELCGEQSYNLNIDYDNYVLYISFDALSQNRKNEYDGFLREIIPANLCINSKLHYNSVKAIVYTACHFKAAQSITVYPYFPEPYAAKSNVSGMLTYKTGMNIKIGGLK